MTPFVANWIPLAPSLPLLHTEILHTLPSTFKENMRDRKPGEDTYSHEYDNTRYYPESSPRTSPATGCKLYTFMNCNFSCNLLEQEQELEAGGRSFPWARTCDGCRAAPSAVYCRADAAYLCASCDTQIHSANRVASRHERVLVCGTCGSAPAVLACRADAAALCAACDAQVHSANPIAQRHQRVPVLPLPAAAIPAAASDFAEAEAVATAHGDKEEGEGEEVDSWIKLRRDSNDNNCTNNMYFGEVDQCFNLVGNNLRYDNATCNPGPGQQYRMQKQHHVQKRYTEMEGCECVVPSQVVMTGDQRLSGYGITGAEQAASMAARTSTYSIINSISFSPMDVGIVPENIIPDIPSTNILATIGAMELSGHSLQMPVHVSSMDREARVLRYKEKKQARKFQKTIRYATRKAYAEARPRIKGRFAKRSDIEHEVDHMFLPDSGYGTVPWF